jgi:lipopolysaccharide export system protein LptA
MLLLIAVLAVLMVQRFRRFSTPVEEVRDELVGDDGDRAIGVYTGFEYVERVAGELIFELMSRRTLGLSSGWHEIEGVRLQFYREGEEGPVLTCESASFNIQTRDARLEGRIRIDLPSGAVLTTDAGTFEAGSRRFTTGSAVDFVQGTSFGRAGSVDYDLERDQITLGGGVQLTSEHGTTLIAPLAVYDRTVGTIDFPRGGTISSQSVVVRAPRFLVRLEEVDGEPQQIMLSGGVTAEGRLLEDEGRFEAQMEEVEATRDRRGRWQIDATTSGPWVTVRFLAGEGYFERVLETWVLRGVIGELGILNLRCERGVCIREIPTEGSPRSGEARTARVWFDDGVATDVELVEEVVLREQDIEGRAYRARLSPEAGLVMLHGDPTGPERVLLTSERGRVSCDRAQLFSREDRAEARGNVQGIIEEVSLMGDDADGAEEGPVHFAAETVEVIGGGEEYRLRDNSRLWQGHRLLLADDVVSRNDASWVRAAGHVRTTLPASSLDADADPTADVVVVSRSLDYDGNAGTAIYRGNVRYSDPEHTLSAAELKIFFDNDDRVTAVEAVGAIELVELATDRRMTGQRARREVQSQIMTIEGSPARLTDPTGNAVSGSSLTWNQADGTVAVTGGTETIYYPEEEP